jgi:hypothetical protein
MKWYGTVVDRLEDTVMARTIGYRTFEQATHAAVALAKRKGLTGDRYAIRVTE